MYKQLKKDQGFTIIEVMIVLAIAGLILLIVFLAVPALQRNARNTSLKNDASAVGAAVTEFGSNNSGSLPNVAGTTQATTTVTVSSTAVAGAVPATAKVQGNDIVTPKAAVAIPVNLPVGSIWVDYGQACPGTTASARTTAVLYAIETTAATASVGCISA